MSLSPKCFCCSIHNLTGECLINLQLSYSEQQKLKIKQHYIELCNKCNWAREVYLSRDDTSMFMTQIAKNKRYAALKNRCVGTMIKEGSKYKTWRSRFFSCVKGNLSYYKSTKSELPITTFEIHERTFQEVLGYKNKQNCIRIHFPDRRGNPFHFHSKSRSEMLKWIDNLVESQGHHIKTISDSEKLLPIEVYDVKYWNQSDILSWIRVHILNRNVQETFSNYISQQPSRFSGEDLLQIRDSHLQFANINELHHNEIILAIRMIRFNRIHCSGREIIFKKLEVNNIKILSKQSQQLAISLGHPIAMKGLYLHSKESDTIMNEIPQKIRFDQNFVEIDDEGEESEEESDEGNDLSTPQRYDVYFLLTNRFHTNENYEELLNPITSTIPEENDDGYHLCIIVGSYFLNFNRYHTVIPRKILGFMQNCLKKMNKYETIEMSEHILLDRITSLCIDINLDPNCSKMTNCGFIEKAIKILSLSSEDLYSTKFWKQLKKEGPLKELRFTPSTHFQQNFQLDKSCYVSWTEKELNDMKRSINNLCSIQSAAEEWKMDIWFLNQVEIMFYFAQSLEKQKKLVGV